MMATTHAAVGAAVGAAAAAVAAAAPELTPVLLAAGAAGGVFPDFDLYAGHRRTLHFPVYYWVAAAVAVAVAVAAPSALTVAASVFVVAAAAHSAMDAVGGGLELRPWEATSQRAVYNHFHGRWEPPRRWIRYDGAPEDLLLAGAATAPTLFVAGGDPVVVRVALGALAVSAGYVALRRPLASVAERLAAVAPAPVRPYVPDRFL
ncbi:metal-dependent hydrolase [Halobaculum sp. P14]|uniref:metal-dependent hydrolase n=1 Tax=Halobaculum sp. P14 TaxID=3421638 RepID=UPI003EBC79FB